MHFISQILEKKPYKLKLKFKNGEELEIDLEQKLREWSKGENSKYKDLLDKDYFKTVKVNPESESIFWDNGIDFCPDTLYKMSKENEEVNF